MDRHNIWRRGQNYCLIRMAAGGQFLSDLPKIPNFDSSGDVSNLGIPGTRWLRSFELYVKQEVPNEYQIPGETTDQHIPSAE